MDKPTRPTTHLTPTRRRLPRDRDAITHSFQVGDVKGYLTVGLFEDGAPGEVFLHIAKEGSTVSGFADVFAVMVSMGLQYGVPLEDLCKKFVGVQFEPDGKTRNADIPFAKSVVDYVFRWLERRFVK